MKKYSQKSKSIIWTILGILAVSVVVLPYLLLGEASYVQIHDQMDGEILNYIYRAKYLFRGDVIPEFMNGMSKAAMVPPAPFGVFLYALLPPFAAFVTMQWICLAVGYLSMRGLCRYIGCREEIAALTAILFALIPFYPTYGLTALGQPLMILCYISLIKGEKKMLSAVGIVFFAGFSSLTLSGFVWVALGMLLLLLAFVRKEKREMIWRRFIAWFILLATYLVTNLELLRSLLGGGFETHRQEMVLHPTENFGMKIKELLLQGGAYHPVYSAAVLVLTGVAFFAVIAWALWVRTQKEEALSDDEVKEVSKLAACCAYILLGIAVCVLLAALWNAAPVVRLREALGGIVVYFQADRISWCLPMLWMLLLGMLGELLCRIGGSLKKMRARYSRVTLVVLSAVWSAVLLLEGALIFRDSTLNKNLRLLLLPDYEQVTWESIYMEEVFRQIDTYIGTDKDRVSVVSLGIYPSVALYNGYTCADGYSNNYSLNYKHAFREIEAAELEKQEEVLSYFDEWGNRLYLVSAEYGFNGMVQKGQGITFANLSYDLDAMKELNIGYLFAAAPIADAEEMGISPVREEPFSNMKGYYEVWVYKIP